MEWVVLKFQGKLLIAITVIVMKISTDVRGIKLKAAVDNRERQMGIPLMED